MTASGPTRRSSATHTSHPRPTEGIIAEGNTVVARNVMRGIHTGELMGIPATVRTVTLNDSHIVRVANGKTVEHWGAEDNLGMMQQLGVVEGDP